MSEENIKNENLEEEKNQNEKTEKKEEKKQNKEMVPKEEYDELDDRYKRILAEFENFKKRSGKEREGLYNSILSDVVEVILPVLDNLENAANAKTEDTAYQDGVKLVMRQFSDALKSFNVEAIEAIGQKFDPELHEAVSHIEDDTKGEQEIVQEYRKGYRIGNKVIRHSMVIVAN